MPPILIVENRAHVLNLSSKFNSSRENEENRFLESNFLNNHYNWDE